MAKTVAPVPFEYPNVLANYSIKPLPGGAEVWIFVPKAEKAVRQKLESRVLKWQLDELKAKDTNIFCWTAETGPIFLFRAQENAGWENSSDFGNARDMLGGWARENLFSFKNLHISFFGISTNYVKGALHGLGLASLESRPKKRNLPSLSVLVNGKALDKSVVATAQVWTDCQNLARHLVNRPAAEVDPITLSAFARHTFSKQAGVSVKVLGPEELKAQKFGLLYGVGKGSQSGAHLVHLRYRPKGSRLKPVALVGKGVTFDTGGLDIKNASGMRLMKKDMAGAAVVFALFKLTTSLRLKRPLDVYLPLAENCVSDRAMRPGDILVARNGLQVEIDNTDAEGRLVMGDALCLAAEQKGVDAPEVIVDVSTLTGAMRVALGLDVAGYFSNSNSKAEDIDRAASAIGELSWRMPLVHRYFKGLRSTVADMTNSSSDGFGGAITAALFLEKFVGDIPWLHFDVMSWSRSPEGPYAEGGNAQCFQILAQWLTGWAGK